jgi:hypothetical protein
MKLLFAPAFAKTLASTSGTPSICCTSGKPQTSSLSNYNDYTWPNDLRFKQFNQRKTQPTIPTMAENAPPGSSKDAATDGSRGMPYYERLRRDLRESLQKKRLIDNNLVGELCRSVCKSSCLLFICSSPSKTISYAMKQHTSRRPAPATSSKASTTTSRARQRQQQPRGLVLQPGAKLRLAMRTEYSVAVRRASFERHPLRALRKPLPHTHPPRPRPSLRASRAKPQTA